MTAGIEPTPGEGYKLRSCARFQPATGLINIIEDRVYYEDLHSPGGQAPRFIIILSFGSYKARVNLKFHFNKGKMDYYDKIAEQINKAEKAMRLSI